MTSIYFMHVSQLRCPTPSPFLFHTCFPLGRSTPCSVRRHRLATQTPQLVCMSASCRSSPATSPSNTSARECSLQESGAVRSRGRTPEKRTSFCVKWRCSSMGEPCAPGPSPLQPGQVPTNLQNKQRVRIIH